MRDKIGENDRDEVDANLDSYGTAGVGMKCQEHSGAPSPRMLQADFVHETMTQQPVDDAGDSAASQTRHVR